MRAHPGRLCDGSGARETYLRPIHPLRRAVIRGLLSLRGHVLIPWAGPRVGHGHRVRITLPRLNLPKLLRIPKRTSQSALKVTSRQISVFAAMKLDIIN